MLRRRPSPRSAPRKEVPKAVPEAGRSGLGCHPLVPCGETSGSPLSRHTLGVSMTPPGTISFRGYQHVVGQCWERLIAERAAVDRCGQVLCSAELPPAGFDLGHIARLPHPGGHAHCLPNQRRRSHPPTALGDTRTSPGSTCVMGVPLCRCLSRVPGGVNGGRKQT